MRPAHPPLARLKAHFPPELDTVFLVNSGSEANDLAIRLARVYTNRSVRIESQGGGPRGSATSKYGHGWFPPMTPPLPEGPVTGSAHSKQQVVAHRGGSHMERTPGTERPFPPTPGADSPPPARSPAPGLPPFPQGGGGGGAACVPRDHRHMHGPLHLPRPWHWSAVIPPGSNALAADPRPCLPLTPPRPSAATHHQSTGERASSVGTLPPPLPPPPPPFPQRRGAWTGGTPRGT